MRKIINKKIRKIKLISKIIVKVYYQKFLIFISKYLNRPLNKPTSIIIEITKNCTLHCQQCNLWKSKPEKQMTFAQAKKIIDNLHNWLGNFYLFFTGGEPFINKNLPKIIKYAQNQGIICHINSNAILINQKLAQQIIDSKLDSISISLDGAKASTHDSLRGAPGTFKKLIKAIKLLQNGPNIHLNTVIMKPNVKELASLIKLSQKLKINGVNFQYLLPNLASNDSPKDLLKSHLWPKVKEVKLQIQKIIKLSQSQKNNLVIDQNHLNQIINYYHNPISTNQKFICAAGINNFIVNRKGDVHRCFEFPPIGNIFKSPAQKIWLGKIAQQQRKTIRKCQKVCKLIACNKINTNRQIKIEKQSYDF
jgi:AdoMet-dependent heme synthase